MIMIERFKEYLDAKGIANARAEKDCGFSNGLIGNALKTKTTIGSDKLEKILTVYQDLSAEWLLRGTGNMIVGKEINHEQFFKAIGLPANSKEIIQIWMKYMDFNNQMQKIYQQSIKEQ